MSKRVLLTTTSFQDTPGSHQDLLNSQDWDLVRERGPLSEERMLELAGDFDAFLCGDDALTQAVIDKCLPRLQCISKYGIGLDKIDVAYATEKKIPVLFTPGVNHTTVAEHAIGFMLSLSKKIQSNANDVRDGKWVAGWKKPVGNEIMGKTLGIIGMGRIGKEVATRARAFGMEVIAFNRTFDTEFAAQHGIQQGASAQEVIEAADIISLHCALTPETKYLIDAAQIERLKDGVTIINCARGEVVHSGDVAAALASGKIAGFAADVLDAEPPAADHPLLNAPNSIITAHIASRTHESVQRQANRSLNNLINFFEGGDDILCSNGVI
ncbi:MAG: D-3-phosphoglycerate dehydrogenase [Rubritalea sp.]|jgi:D-3-phosphoglycerate dehydrogenase